MKKATIENLRQVTQLAVYYARRGEPSTIIEIIIDTREDYGERVRLPQIGAERTVMRSKLITGIKVVHITADEWLTLWGVPLRAVKQTNGDRAALPPYDGAQ